MRARSWTIGFVLATMVVAIPAARADDDETTATYVATCTASPHSCQESVGLGVVMGLAGRCVPQSMEIPSDAQILQVMAWLNAHPDVHPDDWVEAVDAAIAAIYPCSN